MSIEAARVVYSAREAIAEFFNAPDPLRVIFTSNATYALNLAFRGLCKPGDRIVTTGIEHNSVMRPLRQLEREGVELVVVQCSPDGQLDFDAYTEALRSGATLVALNHASNVVGTLLDARRAVQMAHAAGALVLLDAAQTAGVVPIDIRHIGADLLAFSGHKGLLGPAGTGGLVIGESVDVSRMRPLVLGGTGSNSGHEDQPERLPDKFESGTPNSLGIAGLGEGVRFVLERGAKAIRERETAMTAALIEGLTGIDRVHVYGSRDPRLCTSVVSFTVDGLHVSEVAMRMEEYAVMCRVGLHCAPTAHRTIGTYPEGTVRLSPGVFTTDDEIERTIEAVRDVVRR